MKLSTTPRHGSEIPPITLGGSNVIRSPGGPVGHLIAEKIERDEVLARLEVARAELVAKGLEVARELAASHGSVTSIEVRAELLRRGVELSGDLRWLGAIFHRKGWIRVGWDAAGSHGRPCARWALEGIRLNPRV